MDFYNKVKISCEQKKNIKLSEMTKILDLSSGMPTKWKNGLIPNGETLIKIADFLDESIDYLLGREQTKKEPTIISYSGNERINSIAKEILKTDLTEEDIKLIEFILDKYKK